MRRATLSELQGQYWSRRVPGSTSRALVDVVVAVLSVSGRTGETARIKNVSALAYETCSC